MKWTDLQFAPNANKRVSPQLSLPFKTTHHGWFLAHYLELEVKYESSLSSLYFFLGFAMIGVSCSMVCMSEVTECEIPLEKTENKMGKNYIRSWRHLCSLKNAHFNLYSQQQQKCTSGVKSMSNKNSTCIFWHQRWKSLARTGTNYTKHSHTFQFCLWRPLSDESGLFPFFWDSNLEFFMLCWHLKEKTEEGKKSRKNSFQADVNKEKPFTISNSA